MMGESWTPPTLAEIASYVAERRLNVNPEKFYSYYSRSGFTYRGLPMDWKSKLADWDRTEYKREQSKNVKVGQDSSYPKNIQEHLAHLKYVLDNNLI